MKVRSIGFAILALLISLTGCGNTGDLYLPEDSTTTFISNFDVTEE
jgi:predicted small lipoprotein YifL